MVPLETGDEIMTYATIKAQNFQIPMPRCKVDLLLNEGDRITVGDQKLTVWHTPGHTAGQISLKMGNLLFSGDNILQGQPASALLTPITARTFLIFSNR